MDAISIKENEFPCCDRSNIDTSKPKRTKCHDARFKHRRQCMIMNDKNRLTWGLLVPRLFSSNSIVFCNPMLGFSVIMGVGVLETGIPCADRKSVV